MKLTREYLEGEVGSTAYSYDGLFTICTITTKSGTKLVGTSGVLDPDNYDKAIGEKVAYENALNQLWALEGYFFKKLGLAEEKMTPEQALGSLAAACAVALTVAR